MASISELFDADAWREVGIRITGGLVAGGTARMRRAPPTGRGADSLTALNKQMEALSAQMKVLVKDVAALKGKK